MSTNDKIKASISSKICSILNEKLNNNCFDCGKKDPKFISINNGIFICENCCGIHKKFPKNVSILIENNLESLEDELIGYLFHGGNKKLKDFLSYDFPPLEKIDREKLYITKGMEFYRKKLCYLVEGGLKPIRPDLNEATQYQYHIDNEINTNIPYSQTTPKTSETNQTKSSSIPLNNQRKYNTKTYNYSLKKKHSDFNTYFDDLFDFYAEIKDDCLDDLLFLGGNFYEDNVSRRFRDYFEGESDEESRGRCYKSYKTGRNKFQPGWRVCRNSRLYKRP